MSMNRIRSVEQVSSTEHTALVVAAPLGTESEMQNATEEVRALDTVVSIGLVFNYGHVGY